MFHRNKPLKIEGSVATLEAGVEGYKITVNIERTDGKDISEKEAENALTAAKGQIYQIESWSSH
jgi:hypothetical protein